MERISLENMLVTPEIAKGFLATNSENRRISDVLLGRYVNEMKNGRWVENTGEAIKISKTGKLLDGQHRLMAIIKANNPIWLNVIYNLEDAIFDVIDTGKSRNASDCFKIAGIKNGNSIPSIILFFNTLEKGYKNKAQKSNAATNRELLEQYEMAPEYWQGIFRQTSVWYNAFSKIITTSFIGGFYCHFEKLNPAKAFEFMEQLTTGAHAHHIIIQLRKKLIQDKISPRKMPVSLKTALIIKAWNHYVTNSDIRMLKFDSIRDEFPTAVSGK